MFQLKTLFYLGDTPVYAYGVAVALIAGACMLWLSQRAKGKLKPGTTSAFALYALVLGLLLGRIVYCVVKATNVFYDEMGDFAFGGFFRIDRGGMSFAGVMLGCVAALFLCAWQTRQSAAALMDWIAPVAALMIALCRSVEPLSRQGFGMPLSDSAFFPFALMNENEEMVLAVCLIEAILAFAVLGALLFLAKKPHRTGDIGLYFFILLGASHIIPESFRSDGTLYIFTFARVTQIALAFMLCVPEIMLGVRAAKRGGVTRALILEWVLTALGVVLCIGGEFALDKSNLPKLLVYAVMFATLCGMVFLILRRLRKEALQ